MIGQPGFFDLDEGYAPLSAAGDPLERLAAVVEFETLGPFLVTSLALAATQFVVGNLIEPRLMGRKLNLSPLVIILSLAFWGGLWGVVGMILCIPIMVILMIICGHFAPTRPIPFMLSSDGEIDWRTEAAVAR